MLVEFRVKNFRSFLDEQVLSMVAAKDKTLADNTIATGLSAVPTLLRSAAVYGANAGGKSNLIKALQTMREVVTSSASLAPGQALPHHPFRLNPASAAQATEFEVTFLLDGVRYQYGFAMTAQRIVGEHLLVYKAFKPQRWFTRTFSPETNADHFEFGTGLKGAKHVWEGATRPNALFLSMAVQLNSESLRKVFDWFAGHLTLHNEQHELDPNISIHMLQEELGRQQILGFLSGADVGIADIEVTKRKVNGPALVLDRDAGKPILQTEEREQISLKFHHVTEHGAAEFLMSDESTGTRKLLFFAGPILRILKQGAMLVIDELDRSLHPLLVQELVRLFHDPETNLHNAQLIFTTHDTSLLSAPGLLRRDQVWLVEKDRDQASALIGLSEFSPRANEALERGYLSGRYAGVPILDNALGLVH